MVHAGRDAQQGTVVRPEMEDVHEAIGRRVGPRVVEGDLQDSRVHEQPVGLRLMHDPAADLLRSQGDEVRVHERLVGELPAQVEDLRERSALVGVRLRRAKLDAVDALLKTGAVARDRRLILACPVETFDARSDRRHAREHSHRSGSVYDGDLSEPGLRAKSARTGPMRTSRSRSRQVLVERSSRTASCSWRAHRW